MNVRATEGLAILCSVDVENLPKFRTSLFDLIADKEKLTVFLKHLGLKKYIPEFQNAEITWKILPLLQESDVNFLPIGNRRKFWAALQQQLKTTNPVVEFQW